MKDKAAQAERERQARNDAAGKTDRVGDTEIYDSEILQIEKVLAALKESGYHKQVNLERFERQIIERFEDIGFVVSVNWYETNVKDTYMPEVEIVRRTEAMAFDRGQQRHEIINDILETGQKGTIKMSPTEYREATAHKRHSH